MLEYLSLLLISYQNVILGKQPVLALINTNSSRGCSGTAQILHLTTLELTATKA